MTFYNVKELTDEQFKELKDALYYWTQYASYYTDEGFYEELFDAWNSNEEELDFDLLIETLKQGGDLPDKINQLFYDKIFNLNDDIIEAFNNIQDAFIIDGLDGIMREVSFDVNDEGYEIYDVYIWEELIDSSLRDKGINGWGASVVDGYYKMREGCLYELNGCVNCFNEVDAEDIFYDYGGFEALEDYLDL